MPHASLGSLFKGRQALLDKMETRLGPIAEHAGVAAPVVALVGQGGVGKSRLAIEQAWRQLGRCCAVLCRSLRPATTRIILMWRTLAIACLASA